MFRKYKPMKKKYNYCCQIMAQEVCDENNFSPIIKKLMIGFKKW